MNTLDTVYTSPLVLADKLISLAKAIDLAGYAQCAEQLLVAALSVLDGNVSDRVLSTERDAEESRRLRLNGRLN